MSCLEIILVAQQRAEKLKNVIGLPFSLKKKVF